MKTISISTQIIQLSGLIGTDDLNDWENDFLTDICEKTQDGKITGTLSDRQVTTIERIYKKHFA
jgi:hypothetical protein